LLKKLLLNRNSILVMAVIAGLAVGNYATHLKAFTIYFLAIAMTFSTTGIDSKALWPPKKIIGPLLIGALLNYLVFGTIILVLAWLLIPDKLLFYGFVVIAAAPPGIAVIPFTYILKGDVNFAVLGTLGAFLASIPLAPLFVDLFSQTSGISPMQLFWLMVKLVLLPLLFSRLLLLKPIKPIVFKIRGKVVDWSFAFIIFTAVGMNRQVFFTDPKTLLLVTLVLAGSTFLLGAFFNLVYIKWLGKNSKLIPANLLTTIKSSGFSVVTAMTLFGEKAAVPSAVLAVIVLSYLIYLSIRVERNSSRYK
jgi:BASS family bile acid:Na+ symporter